MKKKLKNLSRSRINVFKIQNRRGYAAICMGHLTEGRTTDQALRRMAKANPRFSHVDVTGAGHVVCVDKPQGFIAATRAFLGVPG